MTLVSEDLLFEQKINGEIKSLRKDYYSIECPDFVTCIVIKDDKLLVVEQYRHPVNSINTEFVAGMIDPGDTPQEATIKELKEEAGIVPKSLIFLGKCHPVSGQNKNTCYVYLVNDFVETEPLLEEYESFTNLTHNWIPISDFKKMIKTNELDDGVTLMAWCLFLENQS
jgi:ADP-ribose pyrophosphatase